MGNVPDEPEKPDRNRARAAHAAPSAHIVGRLTPHRNDPSDQKDTHAMTAPALQALGALGDPSRRAIFEHLTTREATVTDIADRLPITRSAVSQHLRVLKEAGLV
ncbi:MAG: winged helix-turn-helix transcriptional regulator, partial [Paracoccaceae bacterium]|nr:winged helix-turn-helix transcriptional regulator [Paracoccaceae bacterium]